MAVTFFGCMAAIWMFCPLIPFFRPLISCCVWLIFGNKSRIPPYTGERNGINTRTELGVAFIGGLDE